MRLGKRLQPRSIIATKTGTNLEQVGEVQEPAKIVENKKNLNFVAPKGSVLEVFEASETLPAKISLVLSDKTPIELMQNFSSISAAKTFAPEAPPSEIEIAKGKGVLLSYYLAGGLLLLCAGLAYTGHFKASIVAGITAIIIPITAQVISSSIGLILGCVGLIISATLYFAWYMVKKNNVVTPKEPAKTNSTVLPHTQND